MNQNSDAFSWPELSLPRPSPAFRLAFFTACFVGFITHLYLFTNMLPNHDSIHSIISDNNVLSSGRWSAQLLSCFSTYFELPVVIGLISILALAATAGLTVRILGLSSKVHIVLAAALLVTFPNISAIFSYLFTADAYFLALLLNTLGVYCTKRCRWGWAVAIPMMAVACGTYQSFICYAIGLFLFDCIFMLLDNVPLGKVFQTGFGYIGVCAASLLLYYVILKVVLLATHTQLVDYQGMNQISLSNIPLFLQQFPLAYELFFYHFLTPGYLNTFYQVVQIIFCLFLAASVICLVFLKKLYRDIPRLLLLAAGLALVPLALNFITILAVGAGVHNLMIYAFVLLFLLALKFAELVMQELISRQKPAWRPVFWVNLALCAALVWCGFYTNNISYLRLQLRYDHTLAAANRIVDRVESTPGYTYGTPVVILGHLPDYMYGKNMPEFSDPFPLTGTDNTSLLYYYSLHDLFRNVMGLNLSSPTGAQWDAIYSTDLIFEMPCWPEQGSVICYEGVVLVKLGEV